MKHIYAILQKTHDLLLVAMCLVVLLAVMVITIAKLWLYIFICVPIIFYLYKSKGNAFINYIRAKTRKKS